MLVLSRACKLAPHAYYSMQLPPIHLLFALLALSPVDQCPMYAPFNCTMGLDTCACHSLFGRTDPYRHLVLILRPK